MKKLLNHSKKSEINSREKRVEGRKWPSGASGLTRTLKLTYVFAPTWISNKLPLRKQLKNQTEHNIFVSHEHRLEIFPNCSPHKRALFFASRQTIETKNRCENRRSWSRQCNETILQICAAAKTTLQRSSHVRCEHRKPNSCQSIVVKEEYDPPLPWYMGWLLQSKSSKKV